ncbi:468_t:CDS:1, partial [Diversispora eburnea]
VFMKENNKKELPVGVPAFISLEILPAINLMKEIYEKNEAKILKLIKENSKKEAVLQVKIVKLTKQFSKKETVLHARSEELFKL